MACWCICQLYTYMHVRCRNSHASFYLILYMYVCPSGDTVLTTICLESQSVQYWNCPESSQVMNTMTMSSLYYCMPQYFRFVLYLQLCRTVLLYSYSSGQTILRMRIYSFARSPCTWCAWAACAALYIRLV